MDPDFTIHRAMGQIWAEMGRRLADTVILPIDCRLYADFLAKNRDSLYEGYGEAMEREGIDLGMSMNFKKLVCFVLKPTYVHTSTNYA